jgi:Flp pilus assembly protein TadD
MSANPCVESENQLQAVLADLRALQSGHQPDPTGPSRSDLGASYLNSFGRLESAERRYRAAVRTLAECRAVSMADPTSTAV